MRPVAYLVGEMLKFFFLLTPFVVLSAFMSFTRGASWEARRNYVMRFLLATVLICGVLFVGGNVLFTVMAISVDSFRVGAGLLLMMNALTLARGTVAPVEPRDDDFAVVPLALPIAVGPGTIGTVLVMRASAESLTDVALSLAALFLALVAVGALLLASERIERRLGRLGISILSRITGLVLAAFSAQLVLTGIRNVLLTK
jgi:multiple antibiotic resistance protein